LLFFISNKNKKVYKLGSVKYYMERRDFFKKVALGGLTTVTAGGILKVSSAQAIQDTFAEIIRHSNYLAGYAKENGAEFEYDGDWTQKTGIRLPVVNLKGIDFEHEERERSFHRQSFKDQFNPSKGEGHVIFLGDEKDLVGICYLPKSEESNGHYLATGSVNVQDDCPASFYGVPELTGIRKERRFQPRVLTYKNNYNLEKMITGFEGKRNVEISLDKYGFNGLKSPGPSNNKNYLEHLKNITKKIKTGNLSKIDKGSINSVGYNMVKDIL
jgi:hypothetical protein